MHFESADNEEPRQDRPEDLPEEIEAVESTTYDAVTADGGGEDDIDDKLPAELREEIDFDHIAGQGLFTELGGCTRPMVILNEWHPEEFADKPRVRGDESSQLRERFGDIRLDLIGKHLHLVDENGTLADGRPFQYVRLETLTPNGYVQLVLPLHHNGVYVIKPDEVNKAVRRYYFDKPGGILTKLDATSPPDDMEHNATRRWVSADEATSVINLLRYAGSFNIGFQDLQRTDQKRQRIASRLGESVDLEDNVAAVEQLNDVVDTFVRNPRARYGTFLDSSANETLGIKAGIRQDEAGATRYVRVSARYTLDDKHFTPDGFLRLPPDSARAVITYDSVAEPRLIGADGLPLRRLRITSEMIVYGTDGLIDELPKSVTYGGHADVRRLRNYLYKPRYRIADPTTGKY